MNVWLRRCAMKLTNNDRQFNITIACFIFYQPNAFLQDLNLGIVTKIDIKKEFLSRRFVDVVLSSLLQDIAYRPTNTEANKDALSGDTERGASQPVAAQMLHAGGEREGRRVDGGRGRVLQATPAARRARAPAAAARRVLQHTSSHADLFYCYLHCITLHYTIQFTLYKLTPIHFQNFTMLGINFFWSFKFYLYLTHNSLHRSSFQAWTLELKHYYTISWSTKHLTHPLSMEIFQLSQHITLHPINLTHISHFTNHSENTHSNILYSYNLLNNLYKNTFLYTNNIYLLNYTFWLYIVHFTNNTVQEYKFYYTTISIIYIHTTS